MKLYNILFYYSYLAGMKSHNFEGMPITAGLTIILANMCLHVMIVILYSMFLDAIGLIL